MIAGVLVAAIVALAGVVGFRLNPDSEDYAGGELYPSPVGGAIGLLGGMPLLIGASALAAGVVFALLPSWRSRLKFTALGGFWFLFPGVDALGVLLVALMARNPGNRLLWPVTAITHAIAAIAAVGILLRRRALELAVLLPALVMVGFTIDGSVRELGVPAWEHLLYTSRYLIPAAFLYCMAPVIPVRDLRTVTA